MGGTSAARPQPRARESVGILRSGLLSELDWLAHGFSTRQGPAGADFDLARGSGVRTRNRRLWRESLAPRRRATLVEVHQIHSAVVWVEPGVGRAGDALIGHRAGRLLSVRTADCVPILLADRRLQIFAAVHAGWRGTVARVLEKTVGEMRRAYGCQPRDIVAAIGPSVRACCYQVGEEVWQNFRSQFAGAAAFFRDAADPEPAQRRYPAVFLTGAPPGHPHDPRWNPERTLRLDLAAANLSQLRAAGLEEQNMEALEYCTACRPDLFFSHRRDRETPAAHYRMVASIGRLRR